MPSDKSAYNRTKPFDKKKYKDVVPIGDDERPDPFDNEDEEVQEKPSPQKVLCCRYGIPVLLLTLADYIYNYMSYEGYSEILKDIFSLLTFLCLKNNLCKAQVFKGDGIFHLLNLINNDCSQAIVMLDKLTVEDNIGSFISKNVFDSLANFWKKTIDKVAVDFDTTKSDPHNFNFTPYLNMLLMNRFYDKLFKKPFFNEREMIKCMMIIQQQIYINMADKFIPKAIEYLESKEMVENASLMIDNEYLKIDNEHKLVEKIH